MYRYKREVPKGNGINNVVPRYKLIFYSPLAPVEKIKRALFAVGAGTHAGSKYRHCAFQSMGIGQFLAVGERGADPHIGKVEQVEQVQEARVEVLCVGQKVVKDAVEALKR